MKQQCTTKRIGHWPGVLLVGWFLLSHFSAYSQVSGYLFRDFNADGIRTNSNPAEPGVSGATVRVFVDIDPIPRTTLTRSDGTFSFDATAVPPGQPLRVEFTGFESGYYTGPFGSGSGTTVQFVTSGVSATAIYASVNYPTDYCQSSPPVVTPCYVNGNPLINTDINGNIITDNTKKAGLGDVLVAIPYNATGLAGSTPGNTPAHLATGAEIGAIWAVAFQRRDTQLYSTATMKRHSGLGPLGTGGIYRTDMSDMTIMATTSVPFVDVRSIGIDTGPDTHAIGTGKKDDPNRDASVLASIGRAAIGGMDFSEDDKSLFFINLNDQKLYNVFIDAPARVPTAADVKSWTIADPGCVQGVFRPWALKTYRGKVYVGGVCTGENVETSTTTNPDQPDFALALANRDKLRGFVYRLDPKEGPTAQLEQVLSFPLSYTRGSVDIDCPNIKYWFPWTDKFPEACNPTGTLPKVSWPQPIISDLAFDDDGSLLIGLLDRFGFMAGNRNLSPVLSDEKLYDGFTGGDLLRAHRNENGTYALESNGTAGPYTNPAGVGDGKGPDGGSFFTDKFWLFYNIVAHDAILNGALNMVPGSGEVFSSAFDPYSDPNNEVFRSGGYKMLNPRTGRETRSFVLYHDKPGDAPAANGTFGKAAGLGDAQALCEVAPIEIGNRIWYDDNRNGIQEAYETGIDGLTLSLHDMEDGGKAIANQVTHNGGQFYFNNTTVSPLELLPNHRYQIRLTTGQLPAITLRNGGNSTGLRAGRAAADERTYSVSPYGQGDNLTNSKGVMEGDFIKVDLTTGDYGQNAHNSDFSVYSCPMLTLNRETVQVCEGQRAPDIILDGKYFARFDKIQFVEFDAPQSGTAMYGPGSRVLGEVTPASFSATAAESFTLSGAAISTAGVNKYVYAIVFPAPNDPACRPYDETIIEIVPTPVMSATGGVLSCTVRSVTLTSTATDSKGNSLTGVNYTWTGPNGYTANTQNAVATQAGNYTISAATVRCPESVGIAMVSVTETMSGSVIINSATGGRKSTPTSSVMLIVDTNPVDAVVSWNGPNNFTGIGHKPVVSQSGTYSLTASAQRCTPARARLEVQESSVFCPEITLLPAALTLCPGQPLPSLTASLSYAPGTQADPNDRIDFVYFAQLPTPTELASGGTLLQSVTPGSSGSATLSSTSAVQTANPGNAPVYRYVYAIFRPGTLPSACTATIYASTVIEINPVPEFSLTALSPTCSGANANTDGQIRMLNVDTNAGLKYILSTSPITVPITAIPVPVLANGLLRGNIANPASATTYYVRVNSPAGCVAEKQITLRPASCECPTPDCLPIGATRIR